MKKSTLIKYWLLLLIGATLMISCQRTEKAFHPNGQQKYLYTKTARGNMHGEATWWYPNGNLQLKAEYIDGVIHGKLTRYYENGKPQTEDHYDHGKLQGISREMNVYGKVIVEKTYQNDTLHGISRQYDENGQVVVEGYYEHGYFEGKWLYRDRLGHLTGEGNFSKGTGVVKSWDVYGKPSGMAEYVDNLQHGTELWYDNEGRVVRKRIFDFGDMVSDSAFSY